MDTTRILDPIAERLPTDQATALLSGVAGATSGLAHQLGDRLDHVNLGKVDLGKVDLGKSVRTGRDKLADVVPWMTPTKRSSGLRRWVVAALAAGVIVAVVVALRKRASDPHEPPPRDDWSTGSPNGASPTNEQADREPAQTGA